MHVHVVSFSPGHESPNAVGGFDWFYSRRNAVKRLREFLNPDDPGVNLALVRLPVPDGLAPNAITDYIDNNLDLVEPRGY